MDKSSNDNDVLRNKINSKVKEQEVIPSVWDSMPYNRKYGFGGYPYGNGKLPTFMRLQGVLEVDMFSVRGGKGRWNGDDTDNFKHGGHVFEGWNKEEDVRLTAGIGLSNKNVGWIQTFHPATEEGSDNGTYYGVTKVGSDLDVEGCNFMPSVIQAHAPIIFWNKKMEYPPSICKEQLDLLVETGELSEDTVNYEDRMIVGGAYFNTSLQKLQIYTRSGWQTVSFE